MQTVCCCITDFRLNETRQPLHVHTYRYATDVNALSTGKRKLQGKTRTAVETHHANPTRTRAHPVSPRQAMGLLCSIYPKTSRLPTLRCPAAHRRAGQPAVAHAQRSSLRRPLCKQAPKGDRRGEAPKAARARARARPREAGSRKGSDDQDRGLRRSSKTCS